MCFQLDDRRASGMLLGMVLWKGKWRILSDEEQQSEGLKFLKGTEGTGSWPDQEGVNSGGPQPAWGFGGKSTLEGLSVGFCFPSEAQGKAGLSVTGGNYHGLSVQRVRAWGCLHPPCQNNQNNVRPFV